MISSIGSTLNSTACYLARCLLVSREQNEPCVALLVAIEVSNVEARRPLIKRRSEFEKATSAICSSELRCRVSSQGI